MNYSYEEDATYNTVKNAGKLLLYSLKLQTDSYNYNLIAKMKDERIAKQRQVTYRMPISSNADGEYVDMCEATTKSRVDTAKPRHTIEYSYNVMKKLLMKIQQKISILFLNINYFYLFLFVRVDYFELSFKK